MNYTKNTVYIVGHAKTSVDNAITEQFKLFFISFVVDVETDRALDVGCSATLEITSKFIKNIFMGQKLSSVSSHIEQEVLNRYFGSSQKAILVAYKDAVKNIVWLKQHIIKLECHGN